MLTGEGRRFEVVRLAGTAEEVEAAWLEERRHGVGGSDVAAIVGASPWRSPLEVWLDKTGRVAPDDLSGVEAVAMGVELEPVVRDMYARRHPMSTVRRVNGMLRSLDRPWAQASLDGITADPDLGTGVLEIKTGGSEAAWESGVPEHYLCQVTHYLAVTGYAFADVVALVGDHGLHYREFRVMRDEDDLEAIEGAVDSFWHNFVLADVMPELVGAEGESKALTEWHAASDGGYTDAAGNQEIERAIAEYEGARAALDEAECRRKAAANALLAIIGDHKGLTTDTSKVTWVRGESTRLDTKALKADMPEVFEKYSTTYIRNGGLRVTDIGR